MNAHPKTTADDDLRQRFRLAREAKGWTQADLADHLEVHWVTISKIERGVIAMSRDWISRLSDALGVTVELSYSGGDGADVITLFPTTKGTAIREAREARGWSQAKLAKMAGTSQQQIDRVEKGMVARSRVVPAIMTALGMDGGSQPDNLIPSRNQKFTALQDEIETAYDLLTALDKTGDGIGGDVGHGVSAVALAARTALDNAREMLKAMEAAR